MFTLTIAGNNFDFIYFSKLVNFSELDIFEPVKRLRVDYLLHKSDPITYMSVHTLSQKRYVLSFDALNVMRDFTLFESAELMDLSN
jgi:hypothetical protein